MYGNEKLCNVICYKTKEPVYYNKGTKWESSCDHFLLCYTWANDEKTKAEVERLNRERPKDMYISRDMSIDDVDYFYASKQPEMDTSGT